MKTTEKLAKDLKKGDVVKPFINERTLKRSDTTLLVKSDMQECDGAFQGIYVMFDTEPLKIESGILCGQDLDQLLIQPEELVEVIESV